MTATVDTPHLCSTCRYDLRYHPVGSRCPECGGIIALHDLDVRRAIWSSLLFFIAPILFMLAAIFVLASPSRCTLSSRAEAEVRALGVSIRLWLRDSNLDSLPSTFSLTRLAQGDAPAPYVRSRDLLDPWGNPYIVIPRHGGFSVSTCGSDSQPGGTGAASDITLVSP